MENNLLCLHHVYKECKESQATSWEPVTTLKQVELDRIILTVFILKILSTTAVSLSALHKIQLAESVKKDITGI